MPREANRVSEISATTGTGTVTLAGATVGYRSWLSAFGAANTVVHYGIEHETNGTWEVGIGTFLHASNAIQRDTVLSSSSGGTKIAFTTGTKIVYCDQPAEGPLRVLVTRSADVGVDVYTAASQSASAIRVVQNTTDTTFSVSASGRITSNGGLDLGGDVASGVNDLSRHVSLHSAGYGFNVTSARLNYNSNAGASHDFYVSNTRVARISTAGLEAMLRHSQNGGYFRIGAYESTTHGTGDARLYYDATARELNLRSDNAGSIGNLSLRFGSILLDNDGSAATPSILWTSDAGSNSGIYHPAENTVNIVTGGTRAASFTEGGMVTDYIDLNDRGTVGTPAIRFDPNTGVYSAAENEIQFSTAGNMKVSLNGSHLLYTGARFLVGDAAYTGTSPSDVGASIQGATAGTPGAYSGTVSGAATTFLNRLASNGNIVELYRQSSFIAAISITTGAVTYNTTSDARRKENEREFDSGALVDALQMVEFDWKAEYGGGAAYGTLVDAETAAIIPTAFTHDEEHDVWQADYSKLVPILWREVQDLRARLAALEGS